MTTDQGIRSKDVVLSDGVLLSELIDNARHEVSLRVLSDPEIYNLEMQRLFARTWIMVGHDSEIPNPGDFVTRFIGEDSVIVVRTADGSIDILLNACTHRNMQLCRTEVGSTTQFKCPYHGWVFGQNGQFLGAPFEKEMYFEGLDKPSLALRKARVETLGGVIFGNFDQEAPPLREFFGDFAWYLECILCRTDEGLEVIGAPQRAMMRANWKGPAEQGSVDGYHTLGLHRSMFEIGMFGSLENSETAGMISVDVSANGGGLRCLDLSVLFQTREGTGATTTEERLAMMPPFGLSPEMVPQLYNNLTEGQIEVISSYPPAVGQAFATFEFLLVPAALPDGSVGPFLTLHTWVPRGPEWFEMYTWNLVEKGAPEELKRLGRIASVQTLGSSGQIEQDDSEAWPSQTKAARGHVARQGTYKYPAQRGHTPPDGWPGPGEVRFGFTSDDGQWQWWQRYFRFLLGEE